MKAAVIVQSGTTPSYREFPDPVPLGDLDVVDVVAAGVHHLDIARASRSGEGKGSPFIPGTDGVGRTRDGRRVFFMDSVAPFGSWAERALVDPAQLLEPAQTVDDATAAALGNTGLAAWLSLSWRAHLVPGESVVVLGATGAVGAIAVQAAKALSASTVIAVDRDCNRLRRVRDLGADATVVLSPEVDLTAGIADAAGTAGVNVIIDLLWGPAALGAMRAASPGARHVQIGATASPTVELPAAVLRSAGLDVMGFTIFQAPFDVRRAAYRALTEAAGRGDVIVDLVQVPLSEVAGAWRQEQHGASAKLVLIP